MCTSIVIGTEDNTQLLARTMDFPFVLDQSVIIIPRQFVWKSVASQAEFQARYAFVGMGKKSKDEFIFADGVNEAGLSCASLYFPGYAHYSEEQVGGSVNLAPHEVVTLLLTTCQTIADVKEAMKTLNIMNRKVEFLGVVTPLHWIVADETGASIIIEPMVDGIKIFENKIGTLTNSPDYTWHMTNLRNYIGISQKQQDELIIDDVRFDAFGQGGGSFALPGGYTPPARFVRTVFAKTAINKPQNETEGVEAIFHVLSGVDIPKGNVLTSENASDYTQYTGCMVNTSKRYYFKTYENNQISVVDLLNEDLDGSEPIIWELVKSQNLNYLNASI